MRSIFANSHSLLQRGHTDLVFSQRWMQSRWKTWPQQPHAMLYPASSAKPGSVAEQASWCSDGQSAGRRALRTGLCFDGGLVQLIAADGARVCADVPGPESHGVPVRQTASSQSNFARWCVRGTQRGAPGVTPLWTRQRRSAREMKRAEAGLTTSSPRSADRQQQQMHRPPSPHPCLPRRPPCSAYLSA